MRRYADLLEALNAGYDQGDRWSFNPGRDGLTVVANGETDCSASCAAILRAGGYNIDTRDPIYTGNFKQKAVDAGLEAIFVRSMTSGTAIATTQPGDMLLGPGHVVFVYDRNKWWSAENDEYGRKTGGKTGDQTGMEARFRLPYKRSRGWEWILRPNLQANNAVESPNQGGEATTPTAPPEGREPRRISPLNTDPAYVRIVQEIVRVAQDGERGPKTVRGISNLQKSLGVAVDGEFGAQTAEAYLLSCPNLYKGRGGMPTGAVRLVQWIVSSRVDGSFGDLTEADVKGCQIWAQLEPDGNVGDETKRRMTV